MVDKSRIVPAKDVVPLRITVAIGVENLLIERVHTADLLLGKYSVKLIEGPGNCAFGYPLRCNNSISDLLADKLEFGMRMDHFIWMYVK